MYFGNSAMGDLDLEVSLLAKVAAVSTSDDSAHVFDIASNFRIHMGDCVLE